MDEDEARGGHRSRVQGTGTGAVRGSPIGKPAAIESSAPSKGLLYLALVISAVLASFCFFVYLLRLGDRGNAITGAASLLVTILGLVCTLALWAFERGHIRLRVRRRMRVGLRYGAIVVLVGLLLAGAASLYRVIKQPDLHITEEVRVLDGTQMGSGAQARLLVPEPTRRDHLALIADLTNRSSTGNCVGSARLDVNMIADGVVRKTSPGHLSGEEIILPLDGLSRTATVRVTVRMRDPVCRVDLTVGEAVLF